MTAHAVTHLEFTYFYVKVPFVVILGFGGLAALAPPSGRGTRAADAAAAGLALWALGLTAALLWP